MKEYPSFINVWSTDFVLSAFDPSFTLFLEQPYWQLPPGFCTPADFLQNGIAKQVFKVGKNQTKITYSLNYNKQEGNMNTTAAI